MTSQESDNPGEGGEEESGEGNVNDGFVGDNSEPPPPPYAASPPPSHPAPPPPSVAMAERGASIYTPENGRSTTTNVTNGHREPPTTVTVKPRCMTQVIGTIAAALAHLGIGTIIGFSGVVLPKLTTEAQEGDLILGPIGGTLFTCVIHLGATVGCVVGGIPHKLVGHRWSLLMALPVSLAAWLTLCFSNSIWLLIIARTVMGFTMGVTCFSATNYVTEFAHRNLRKSLLASLDVLRQSGFLLVYGLGTHATLSWRFIALICGLVTTVLPFLIFIFLPNSPRWLILRGRLDEALHSLQFYRGQDYDCYGELLELRQKLGLCKDSISAKDQLKNMKEPVILRYILLFGFIHLVSQFTGEVVISSYIVPIFQAAHVTEAYMDAAVVGAIRVLATLVYFLEVDRVGRKRLVISSFVICGASLGVLAIFFYDQVRPESLMSEAKHLPIIVISIYAFFSNIGFPVLNLVDGELLPDTTRATALAILYSTYYFGGFLAALTYPIMTSSIGLSTTFWIYCGFNVLVVIIDYADLPETRGKSPEEIITMQRLDDLGKRGSSISDTSQDSYYSNTHQ